MSNPLRKAAVLINALDSRSADALLDQMSDSQAAQVRQAIMELDDIDPAEEQQVLREFMQSRGGQPQPATDEPAADEASEAVEFEVSSQALAAADNVQPPVEEKPQPTPFEFLHGTAGERLAGFLSDEHPQTIAMVLSHLPPSRASQTLVNLPAMLQVEVLERIAEMDQTDPVIVREVEQQLHESLAGELELDRRRKAGLSVVQSILAAAGEDKAGVLKNLTEAGAVLAGRLQADDNAAIESFSVEPATFQLQRSPSTHEDRPALAPPGEVSEPHEVAGEPLETLPRQEVARATFEDVMGLDEFDLATLLAAAEPEITLLALTGAPPAFVQQIVQRLPRRQRRSFEQEMESLAPVRLRDIELAQLQLAELAAAMAVAGEIHIPHINRFIAAA